MNAKSLLILPLFGLIILTAGNDLLNLAESSSNKTVAFAGDMDNAMECAFKAIPLDECSPDLMNYEFSSEINETINITNELISNLTVILEEEIDETQ